MKKFGRRFRELRAETNYTQGEMIKDFNLKYHRAYTITAISFYENSKRMPEIDALMDFADYFGVSVSYLLGDSDIRDPDHKYSPPPAQPPQHLTPDEQNAVSSIRSLAKAGHAPPEIAALLQDPEAVQIALRWAALGGDSRALVKSCIIQEERRNENGPALPNRNFAPPESGTERERRKGKI